MGTSKMKKHLLEQHKIDEPANVDVASKSAVSSNQPKSGLDAYLEWF